MWLQREQGHKAFWFLWTLLTTICGQLQVELFAVFKADYYKLFGIWMLLEMLDQLVIFVFVQIVFGG